MTQRKKRVLVCNDDGIDADGLRFAVDALCATERYDVRVAAPATNQSATGAKATLHGALRAFPTRCGGAAVRAVAVCGTPVDALRLGLALHGENGGWRPEAVLSGVNYGNNLGVCMLYSGMLAAASEAALAGLPALAVSYDLRSYAPGAFCDADRAAMQSVCFDAVPRIVDALLQAASLPPRALLCVNLPAVPLPQGQPLRFVRARQANTRLECVFRGVSQAFWEQPAAEPMMTTIELEPAQLRALPDDGAAEEATPALLQLPTDAEVVRSGAASVTVLRPFPCDVQTPTELLLC